MEILIDDIVFETYGMTALFELDDEPLIAANDDEYPEYENLYAMPA